MEFFAAVLAAAPVEPSLWEPGSFVPWLLQMRSWALLFIVLGGLVAVVWAYQDWRRNRLVLEAIHKLELPPSAEVLGREIAKLRVRDPAFDQAAFEKQVGELFTRVVASRAAKEPPPRHEVSDGVWRRAVVETAIERSQGKRKLHSGAQLREARLVGAFCDPHFDALHVRVAFTSRPVEIPFDCTPDQAAARAARVTDKLAAEAWVFVRRPSAKTLAGQASGRCPNCGAPYDGGAASLCGHCQAILNSGSYGWVLAQTMDWEAYRGPWREFTGHEQMVARDPGFCPDVIEDRAALLFWKWQHARAERAPKLAARLCAKELVADLEKEAAELKAKRARRWISEVCVAGVDLLLMELDAEEHRDEVHLRVRWSAKVAEFDENSPPKVAPSSYATVVTLVRQSGATTDLKTGVSSDRCHSCKAANQDADAASCSFCGAAFEPGVHDFVLRDARGFETWMALRQEGAAVTQAVEPYLPAFKFADERKRLLMMMAAMARADGKVTRSERALLKVCCRRWGIGFPEIRAVLDGETPPPELTLKKGSWPARAFLEGLCDAAAIDGIIDRSERAMLASVAKRLGLPVPTVASLRARAEAVQRSLRQAGVTES